MSLSLRILIVSIIGLLGINGALAWNIWRIQTQPEISDTQPTAILVAPKTTAITMSVSGASPAITLTSSCRTALDNYIDLSNQRVYDYFDIYNNINKIATDTLVARIDTLSKQVDPLPEGCPDVMQAAIHANYVSVYMTAPIHLHMIVTRTNADGSMTGAAKQALRMFEREIDIAERTNYELLRLAQ